MKSTRYFLILAAIAAALATVHADAAPSLGSAVAPAVAKVSRPVAFLAADAPAARIHLPAPDAGVIDALKASNARARTKRLDVGVGRGIPDADLATAEARWTAVAGGHVARWSLTSATALSLRVALRASQWPDEAQLRFAGNAQPGMVYGPFSGAEAQTAGAAYWSPVLEGDTAMVEVFVPRGARLPDAAIDGVSHLFVSFADPKAELVAKAAAPCSVNLICRSASDGGLADTGRSVARISFVTKNGGSSLCTGTLLNSTAAGTPYFATAGHCIATRSEAASVTTRWFYETSSCSGTALNPADTQLPGGAVLLYANESEDFSFMRLNASPPAGTIYSGWDATRPTPGEPMTGVHHPDGDVKKVSLGTAAGPGLSVVADGNGYRIQWTSPATGFTEPGSSGSGIFSGNAASGYRFRGTLQGGPLVNCSSQLINLYDYYSRFDLAFPFIAQFLNPAVAPTLGANVVGNPGFEAGTASWTQGSTSGAQLLTNDPALARSGSWYAWLGGVDGATDTLSQPIAIPTGAARLQFWYRIATAETSGNQRYDIMTISIVDANSGATLMDVGSLSNLDRTTGYVESSVFDVSAFANRTVRLQFRSTSDSSLSTSFRIDDLTLNGSAVNFPNQTALWWNAAESGWGINVSHQGDTAFATIFTYDSAGNPMWLVMPSGARQQGNNMFMGALYRTTGPAFNANPFTPIGPTNITEVGDLTLDYTTGTAVLGYRFNDNYVAKLVTKQVFGAAAATCVGVTGGRAASANYQDLWWNPAESGWGLNITHQGNTIFATLFTYAANGQGMWLVLDAGVQQSDGSYLGELYRTTGPAYNANPFTPIGPGNITLVGTMRLRFQNGETGTLEYSVSGANVTKAITRQVFGSPVPLCSG